MKKQFIRNACIFFSGLVLSVSNVGAAVTFDWAVIGNAGNSADDNYCGSVAYDYSITTTEVTTAQYVEFLNAVAATDTYGLYNTSMSESTYYTGINRTGSSGSYEYTVNESWGNRPVVYVSWYDALRFTNWLHNGQLTGAQDSSTTEDGAYTFTGATTVSVRNTEAVYWLTSQDEWYKAAYYDPVAEVYYDYATSSNDVPVSGVDANYKDMNMNYFNGGYVDPVYYSTPVGYYDNDSPYGTYDQTGNVWEWTEELISEVFRGRLGGSWRDSAFYMPASYLASTTPTDEDYFLGFRVASSLTWEAIPEPMSLGLMLLSIGGLLIRRGKGV